MANNISVGGNIVAYTLSSPTNLSGSAITASNTAVVFTFDTSGNLLGYVPGRSLNGFTQLTPSTGNAKCYWISALSSFSLPGVIPTTLLLPSSSSSSSSSLSSSSSSSSSSNQGFFPSTLDKIHVFEDEVPNSLSNAMTQFVATHTDGTQKIQLSQVQQFRVINPNFTVLHYQLGTGNSPFEYIINDQWSSDWTYVNGQESWFAHQTYSSEPQSGSDLTSGRVGNSTPWYQADIANTAWQSYTLTQVLQNITATGSNGWFADSFTYGLGGAGYSGTIPTRYQGTNAINAADWPGGVTWTEQWTSWCQAIQTAFASHNTSNGTNYKFIPNLDARVTGWEPRWYDSSGVPLIDGAFFEGFGSFTDTADWTFAMNQGLNFTTNGKIVIMQSYPSSDPTTAAGQQQVNFYLGTYLLLKGNATYINLLYGGGVSVQYFPQYDLDLGPAVTPLPTNVSSYLWNNVYRRDFQNGFVLVNPGSTTYNFPLGGTYQLVQGTGGGAMTDSDIDGNGNYIGASLTYQAVSSVSLVGAAAAILLS